MRKILEILKRHFEGKETGRSIALALTVALSTVQECLRRFGRAELTWPVDLDEAALEALLYPPRVQAAAFVWPDFAAVQALLLSHKGMTRREAWRRYRDEQLEGLGYSAFCKHFEGYLSDQRRVLRQTHAPGEAMWVDYAGPGMVITDRNSGATLAVRIVVAVLGYSNRTFALATTGETLADWLLGHVLALEYFGGAPRVVVPDNPKALVSKPCRYDPDLNPAYQEFAQHYGVTVLPARVRKPRDKAKVETAVQIVERQLMAPLQGRTFFSLADLNRAIAVEIEKINAQPFQKLDGSRDSWFESERQALQPLPVSRYEYASWRQAKVPPDYHVEVDQHAYSVPHAFVGQQIDIRLSHDSVEIFRRGKRIATHRRSAQRGGFTTVPEHRPERHRAVLEATLDKLSRHAIEIGAATHAVVLKQGQRKHPTEALRNAQGILRLAKDFSSEALESACERALLLNASSYRSVRGLILHPPIVSPPAPRHEAHEHVRGDAFYGALPC